jgi:transcriptional regulator with XRE-family HTH domain
MRDATCTRVAKLLDVLWHGSQSKMAAELGISQAAISQIVRGQRRTGPKVLDRLASHPLVNPAWVYGGDGEPLLAPRFDGAADEPHLPVATSPLPGDPSAFKELLGAHSVAVARSEYRETRYFLPVGKHDPVLRDKQRMVAPGDLILLDTHAEVCGAFREFHDRLAVAMDRTAKPARPRLCALTWRQDEEGDGLEGAFFQHLPDPRQYERYTLVRVGEDGRVISSIRWASKATKVPMTRYVPRLHDIHVVDIDPQDVLGVAVQIVRPL